MTRPTPDRTLEIISVSTDDLKWAERFLEDNKDMLWERLAQLHSEIRAVDSDRDALRERVKELNDELDHSYDHLKSLKWAG